MADKKVAIIGRGMVGTQVNEWFKDALVYDPKFLKSNDWDEIRTADVFFVCVPSPYLEGKEYDLSILDEVVSKIPNNKVIVIKTTVNPGTTDAYQIRYPNKIFMFNPEFLTETTAKDDFLKPDMQILGVSKEGYAIANEIMGMLPPAPLMRIVSLVDAEWVKKLRNAFYAVKVIFFNQIYDLIVQSGADYETVRSIAVEDKMIGNSHSVVFHKGYRGYGGKCLPKDLNSLIDYADKNGVMVELLKAAKFINEHLNDGSSWKNDHFSYRN